VSDRTTSAHLTRAGREMDTRSLSVDGSGCGGAFRALLFRQLAPQHLPDQRL